jgi:hypothetical protein
MHEPVVILHSVLRLALVAMAAGLTVASLRGLVTSSPRPARARLVQRVAVILADLQLAIGLLLYLALSPVVEVALDDFGAAMKDRELRFWAVEHGTMMLLAVVLFHAGKILARRAPDDRGYHRRTALCFGLALVAILAGSPGLPWGEYGRGLLRGWW